VELGKLAQNKQFSAPKIKNIEKRKKIYDKISKRDQMFAHTQSNGQ
jgi:hypothetical protein